MNKILRILLFFFNFSLMYWAWGQSTSAVFPECDSKSWNELFRFDFENEASDFCSSSGHWEISDQLPIAGSFSAKHLSIDGQKASSLQIPTPVIDVSETDLFLSFKLKNGNWDPSGSNKFYMLLLHQSETGGDGYVLGVNGKGSSDLFSVWKYKNGSVGDLVLQSSFDWNANTSAQIDVLRSVDGNWTVCCTDLATEEQFCATGFDDSVSLFDVAEFRFLYTSTRSGLLWIDDVVGFSENPGPRIKSVQVDEPNRFSVAFTKKIEKDLLTKSSFKLTDSYSEQLIIKSVEFISDSLALVDVTDVEDLVLMLSVCDLLGKDGSETEVSTFNFVYRVPIAPLDVLINELLFDPPTGGSDFVELFNNSGNLLDLSVLSLATLSDSMTLKTVSPLSVSPMAFYPEEYLAFTVNYDGVAEFYHLPYSDRLLEIQRMPTYPNDKGAVVLLADSMFIVDEFSYSAKMHNETVSNPDGISLERVSRLRPTADVLNWESASSVAGYATPGYENSQTDNDLPESVIIADDVISPNNDGYHDELVIELNLPESGCLATISIFDLAGRERSKIIENQLVGPHSVFAFSGNASNGSQLPHGFYVVTVEAIHPNGYQFKGKRAFAICRY